jgi:hypothetical protein
LYKLVKSDIFKPQINVRYSISFVKGLVTWMSLETFILYNELEINL